MLEYIAPLWDVFIESKKQKHPLVLATIVETSGSSYKKAGAMMLVDYNLKPHGLLSGGCLETDLAEHSESVFTTGDPKLVDYDLSDDSIFGLGAGCDGQIKILLQKLEANNDYQPFSFLNPTQGIAEDAILKINKKENAESFSAYIYQSKSKLEHSNNLLINNINNGDYCEIKIRAPLKIAICGSGTDTLPLIRQIQYMHWHGYIIDHRPVRLQEFTNKHDISCIQSDINNLTLSDKVAFDAVILMTHNIDRDAAYLSVFNQRNIPYIGLLGPVNRRDKVLKKSGLDLKSLNNPLYAPVGLDLHCNSPEQIALSIIAEIQLQLNNSRTL